MVNTPNLQIFIKEDPKYYRDMLANDLLDRLDNLYGEATEVHRRLGEALEGIAATAAKLRMETDHPQGGK